MPVPVISIAQTHEWEKATWTSGQTEAEVIRRVGLALSKHALQLTRPGDLILILAGAGHNGEDARSAREHLRDRRVDLLDTRNPETDFSRLSALLSLEPALIIDGLFGIGINRPLDSAWRRFIDTINSSRAKVLAVDIPSGLDADSGNPQGAAIRASVTMTVGAPKKGLLASAAWPYVGRLEVAADVGLIPCPVASEWAWTLPADFAGFPPARCVAGHKGDFGHLALICGSAGYHGAAVLAGRGAQRAQPGLISLYTHDTAYVPVAAQLQSVMVHPWTTSLELPKKISAVFIGPGLAAPELPDAVRRLAATLWRQLEAPVIVDASALDWLPQDANAGNGIRVVTPHPGEAARLLKTTAIEIQADRAGALRRISERLGGCWVLLKGHQSLIGRDQGELFVNSSGNPHLAQGGAGDLLGGYMAGLLCQPALQQDPLRTIRFAVWQHGAAADRLQCSRSNWTVEDLANELGGIPS